MYATIQIYKSDEATRVMIFGGLLSGMMAAKEGDPSWDRGFELARQLNVEVKPAFGFTGNVAQK